MPPRKMKQKEKATAAGAATTLPVENCSGSRKTWMGVGSFAPGETRLVSAAIRPIMVATGSFRVPSKDQED